MSLSLDAVATEPLDAFGDAAVAPSAQRAASAAQQKRKRQAADAASARGGGGGGARVDRPCQ